MQVAGKTACKSGCRPKCNMKCPATNMNIKGSVVTIPMDIRQPEVDDDEVEVVRWSQLLERL